MYFVWLIACFFSASFLLTSCANDNYIGYDDDAESDSVTAFPSAGNSPLGNEAETALSNRNIEYAQQIYTEWLQQSPDTGQAAAGLAITDLLLMLDSIPVTKLITENLAARKSFKSTDTIYGPDGILYWLSRGVSWEDQGQFQGIFSLIENKLPWSKNQLTSLINFVENLSKPINILIPNLVSIADRLHHIEKNFQIALNDPNFNKIYIPGEIFHNDKLALTLSHSEIALIQSALAATRAAIYLVSAYQHDWTLQKAFGSWRSNPANADDAPLFIPAFGPDDYSVRYLDQNLFREVARPDQLPLARLALADSLKHAQNSLQYGITAENFYVLQWNEVDSDYVHDTLHLLKALESALFKPTELPFSEPTTQADFSPFFTAEKTLDPAIPWMLRMDHNDALLSDDNTAEGNWVLNDDARYIFFVQDIYTPRPKDDPIFPVLELDSLFDNLLEPLLNNYIEHVEDAYLLAR